MPRPRLTDSQRQEFRQRLCKAALARYAESGADGLSMRKLAQELGCSPMTPYRYFENQDEIVSAVRALALSELRRFQARAVAAESEAVERLRAWGRSYLEFAGRRPNEFRLLFQLDQPSSDLRDLMEAREVAYADLRDLVGATARGTADSEDVDRTAHRLWSGVHGLASLKLAGQLTFGLNSEDLVDELIDERVVGPSAASGPQPPSAPQSGPSESPAVLTPEAEADDSAGSAANRRRERRRGLPSWRRESEVEEESPG